MDAAHGEADERAVVTYPAPHGVDAITLSSLRLLESGTLQQSAALTAIALAVGSNLVAKAALTAGIGGAALRGPAVLAFALPVAGLLVGAWLLRALA